MSEGRFGKYALVEDSFNKINSAIQISYVNPPSIRIVLLETPNIDAYATLRSGAHIAISTGLCDLLDTYFLRIAFEAEEILGERIPGARPLLQYELSNDVRKAIFNVMREGAYYFILLHEFAHILKGHLGLMQQAGSSRLSMVDWFVPRANLTAADMRAFEYDADQSAAHNMHHLKVEAISVPLTLNNWNAEFGQDVSLHSIASFAALSAFRLLSSGWDNPEDKCHPPMPFRIFLVATCLSMELFKENPGPYASRLLISTEEYYSEINRSDFKANIGALLGPEGLKRSKSWIDEVHQTLDVLKPHIASFATVGRP